MEELLKNPDRAFKNSEAIFLKKGNTSTVIQLPWKGRMIVIKRYNIKSFWHFLRKFFRESRAAICWRNSHLLEFYDMDCARPIAFVEKRMGFFRGKSYYISEYVDGIRAWDYFHQVSEIDPHVQKTAENIIHLFQHLKKYRIKHGDTKAMNIILCDQKSVLIDLDAMREYKCDWLFNRAHQKDIARFRKNWIGMPRIDALFARLYS